MLKNRLIEIAVKMLVAALTAFLTALTTTSCIEALGEHFLNSKRVSPCSVTKMQYSVTKMQYGGY